MPYVRVLPIQPGKAEECKQFITELLNDRRAQFAASQRAEGIREEHFFIQSDHRGDYLIVYNDGDTQLRERARQIRAQSTEPFDVWFKERFRDIHGIDLEHPHREGGARIELLASWRDELA